MDVTEPRVRRRGYFFHVEPHSLDNVEHEAAEGITLRPGAHPIGYEDGSLGWFTDEPAFGLPDGSAMQTRVTAPDKIRSEIMVRCCL